MALVKFNLRARKLEQMIYDLGVLLLSAPACESLCAGRTGSRYIKWHDGFTADCTRGWASRALHAWAERNKLVVHSWFEHQRHVGMVFTY